MNNYISIYLLGIFLWIIPFSLFSQTNDYKVRKCFGYQRDSCPTSKNIYYKINEQSRSALFVKGQSSQTPLTIYNGRDYRISLCWDPVLGSQIQFKLIDMATNEVLYDNSKDNFSDEFEFTVTRTSDISIEIFVSGSSSFIEAEKNEDLILVQKDKEMGCVGILIEYMITPTKGF